MFEIIKDIIIKPSLRQRVLRHDPAPFIKEKFGKFHPNLKLWLRERPCQKDGQATVWEKISANSISKKGHLSQMYKQLLNSTVKQTNN